MDPLAENYFTNMAYMSSDLCIAFTLRKTQAKRSKPIRNGCLRCAI
jgi:hypothetical protein